MRPEVIHGYHAIEQALRRGGVKGTLLIRGSGERGTDERTAKDRTDMLANLARSRGVPVSRTKDAELSRLSPQKRHGGVLLLLEAVSVSRPDARGAIEGIQTKSALVLLLDGVTDPQNFGAILRSCDLFAVDLVIVPSRRSASLGGAVSRSSAGASFHVPVSVVPNLVQGLDLLKQCEFWIYGADVSGEPLQSHDLSGRAAVVLGSEGSGIRRIVKERCDRLIRIPTSGHVDSFNVSVAAGILMYEARRQQGFPSRSAFTGS